MAHIKLFIPIIILSIITGCKTSTNKTQENNIYPFFVGTYTDGESEGIYKYLLQKDGSLEYVDLAAKTDNPSFLTFSPDQKFIVAVNEINSEKDSTGNVESLLIAEDSLISINKTSSGGGDPCFVTVNKNNLVLVANYSGGNIGLLQLNEKGNLSDLLDIEQHFGSDITERQKAPHAHSVWFEPESANVISVDLGTNELWFSHLDTATLKLLPSNPEKLKMEPGAGPRHLTFHPNGKWIYVVNELNSTVTLLKKTDNGKYEKGASTSTLPDNFIDSNICADIHISSDGNFLYASNRGHNSIVIYKVNAKNGSLTLIAHQPTLGEWPRNFTLSPDENYLLVANQYSQNIVSFKRDKHTGLLKYSHQIDAPTPVCILFYPD